MTLYKYLHSDRIDVLENNCIRYTQPADLNDPFEMTPAIEKLATSEYVEQWQKENLERTIEREIRQRFPASQYPIAKAFFQQNKASFMDEFHREFGSYMEMANSRTPDMFHDLIKSKLLPTIGVLSLTERSDNLLMWSHYAEQHRGFVLAVDEQHPAISNRRSDEDEFYHPRKVEYSDRKTIVSLADVDGPSLLLRKSLDWEYEDEWRVIKPLDDADKVISNSIHLFDLPAAAIEGVILGAGAKDEFIDAISDIFQSDRYQNTWLRQAEVQREVYALKFVDTQTNK